MSRAATDVSFRAVLFDLDGTLLNTLEDLADAMNRALEKEGFPTHRVDAYRHFVGNGSSMLVRRALPPERREDDGLIRSCLDRFLREYRLNWMVKTRPYDGVAGLLEGLTRQGFKMAVLSNKIDEITKQVVAHLLSQWKFDAVVGQRQGVPAKPDPTAALEIAGRLGVSPEEFVYLGDSAVDMKTSVAAGMFPVGALWGFRSEDELLAGGARVLIGGPMDLLGLLKIGSFDV
jgi:phosphoglycolate phosphatase